MVLFSILGLTALLLLGYSERIRIAYLIHRLKIGSVALESLLGGEPSPREMEALQAFVRTPAGLRSLLRLVVSDRIEPAVRCGGEGLEELQKALLWVDSRGVLRVHCLCFGSKHHIVRQYGGERMLSLGLHRLISGLPQVTAHRDREYPSLLLSVLPCETAVMRFSDGLQSHPLLLPDCKHDEQGMRVLLERE
jgi:hypothetical protein